MTDIGTITPHYYLVLAGTLDFRVKRVDPLLGEGYMFVTFDGTGSREFVPPQPVCETEAEAHLAGTEYVTVWRERALSNYRVMCTFGLKIGCWDD